MSGTIDMLYERMRAEELHAQRERVRAAYARSPRLSEIDDARRQLVMDAGARRLSPAESLCRLDELSAEEGAVLRQLGLPEDYLQLRYRCPLCRDTGYVGSAPRRACVCRLKKREQLAGNEGVNDRETFACFDESVYPDEMQKKRAVNAMRLSRAYAEALPAPEKPNLLLTGMPGLGKSYLGNAVACAAIERGVDAMRVTAYRFVQDMLSDIREHTQNARRYNNVPLLVLDDLGSEPDIPNVSTEWLFAVVNERVLARRATVCITNLTLAQLQARYGERVMSRLCDRNTTLALQLTGKNLRTL